MVTTRGLRVRLDPNSLFGSHDCTEKAPEPQNCGRFRYLQPPNLIEIAPPPEFTYHPADTFYRDPGFEFQEDEHDLDDSGSDCFDLYIENPGLEYPKQSDHEVESDYEFDLPSPPLASMAIRGSFETELIHGSGVSHLLHLSFLTEQAGAGKAMKEEPLDSDFANKKVLRLSHPATSHCVKKTQSESGLPARHRRRRSAKAKLQYLRDCAARSRSVPLHENTAASAAFLSTLNSEGLGPKRKHCAFVQEQELKCLFDACVGTPHLSELQPGDDVSAQLNVDEFSVGGDVTAFSIGEQLAQGLSVFEITDIPVEELKLR